MRLWISCSLTFVAACAHRGASEPSVPQFSSPSSPSFSTSYAQSVPSVHQVHIQADLIVRPDTVCFPITIEARGTTGVDALAAAKASLVSLQAATKSEARVDDINTRTLDEEGEPASVTVRAVVERPLPEGDAFERAQVVAEMNDGLRLFKKPSDPTSGATRPPQVHVGEASPGLKDLEQHRQKLLDAWANRVRALAKTTDEASITLINCSPPGAVQVAGGTLEKLGLSLPINCTISVQPRSK